MSTIESSVLVLCMLVIAAATYLCGWLHGSIYGMHAMRKEYEKLLERIATTEGEDAASVEECGSQR